MRRDEFVLRVESFDDLDEGMQDSYAFMGCVVTLSISAWVLNEAHMIDQHITDMYPELLQLGFEELQEGDMIYEGTLSKQEMMDTLIAMGYNAVSHLGEQNVVQPQDVVNPPQMSLEELHIRMAYAVEGENYEEAARLRDEINARNLE